MSFYDIVILVVLIGAIAWGYWKGLAWQIASVAAIVVSYIVSINFREQVASYIQAEEPWNKIGAMLILFVGCSLAIWVIYGWVTKSMERMELKSFDRQIGALVGGITGALLCMVITMFSVSLLGDQAQQAIHDSKFGPHVVHGIYQVHGILPAEIASMVDGHIERFEKQIGQPPLNGFDSSGYPYPQRQAEGDGGFQGGWTQPNPSGYQLIDNSQFRGVSQPVENQSAGYQTGYQTQTTQTQYGAGQGAPTYAPRYSQPVEPQPTQPQPNAGNTWKPPTNFKIEIDSQDLLNRLFKKE